jgi:hypothetical protein
VKAYPRETPRSLARRSSTGTCRRPDSFGAFFGGVTLSLLYDNLKIAVAKICGDGKRERTRAFTELVSQGRGAGQVRARQLHDADPGGGKLRRS